MNDFYNQTRLGEMFNVTSHKIGKWLMDIGLRTREKIPSSKAFNDDFVITTDNGYGGYYYIWHKQKTVKALVDAGHKLDSLYRKVLE